MIIDRKKDARDTVALGGLVVRAGLRQADRAFLLGVLLEAAAIPAGSPEHDRLSAKGGKAFQRDWVSNAKPGEAGPAVSDDPDKATGD